MKPFAVVGLCFALLATPALAQGGPPKPPELLARLKAAIPPDNGPEPGQTDADQIRQTLLPLNPGREKDAETLAQTRFACEQALMSKARILDLIVESADKRMTQPEIERIVTFYEGPEYKTLASLEGRPDDDPEVAAMGQKLMADPIFMKFTTVVRDGMTDYMLKPGMMDAIMACEADHAEALEKSGLAHP